MEHNKEHVDALAWNYAIRIKNPEKKRYAKSYADYKRGIRKYPPEQDNFNCSIMAMQAVRLQIDSFYS